MSSLLDTIPRADVKLARHKWGAGRASVVHRATGIELGEVAHWPDGIWVAYAGPPETRAQEKVGEGRAREDAVEAVLDIAAHSPATYDVLSGRVMGMRLRDATEAEARSVDPVGWAWWDKVRALFTAG